MLDPLMALEEGLAAGHDLFKLGAGRSAAKGDGGQVVPLAVAVGLAILVGDAAIVDALRPGPCRLRLQGVEAAIDLARAFVLVGAGFAEGRGCQLAAKTYWVSARTFAGVGRGFGSASAAGRTTRKPQSTATQRVPRLNADRDGQRGSGSDR